MSPKTPSEAQKQTLLRELERALFDALAESPEVHQLLWRIQRAGLTPRLTIDCQGETSPERPVTGRDRSETTFRIDSEDLSFLRSIGIDPTRRRRPRKRSG